MSAKPKKAAIYPEIKTDFISFGASSYSIDFQGQDPKAGMEGFIAAYNLKAQFKISYLLLNLHYENGKNDTKYFSKLFNHQEPVYNGNLPTGESVNSPINNHFKKIEYNMGFSYASSQRFHFVLPYTGLGYRVWEMEKAITSPNVLVNYRYEWFYVPIGFKLQYQLFNSFIIGLDCSYRFILGPRASVYTKKIYESSDPDVTENAIFFLDKGLSYRLEIPFEYYFSSLYGMQLSFWHDYVHLNHSKSMTIMGLSAHPIALPETTIKSYGFSLAFNIYLE